MNSRQQSISLCVLVLLVFVKGWIFPGWYSALELLSCFVLVGFLQYFRKAPPEEKRMQELEDKIAVVQSQLTDTRLKVGLRQVI